MVVGGGLVVLAALKDQVVHVENEESQKHYPIYSREPLVDEHNQGGDPDEVGEEDFAIANLDLDPQAAGDQGRNPENKGHVSDVRTDHIPEGEVGVVLESRENSDHQLRNGSGDGHNYEPHQVLRNPELDCNDGKFVDQKNRGSRQDQGGSNQDKNIEQHQAILSVMVDLVQFKKIFWLWLPVLVWAGLIFYFSSVPNLAVGEGTVDFLTRKPAHLLEYALLFLLIFRAIKGSFGGSWKFREIGLGSGIITFLYAVSDELHQALTPTRSGKIEDLGFDLLGILLTAFFLSRSRK